MGSRSGFDSQGAFEELQNVVNVGSGAVTAATRQAKAQFNLGLNSDSTAQVAGVVKASSVVIADANKNVAGLGQLDNFSNAGSTRTLNAADNGKTIVFDQATGSVVQLPAATGSGIRYNFVVGVLATSNSHIIYTDGGNAGLGSGVFKGVVFGARIDSGNAVLGFASTTNDTITLNRTTTGSVSIGEWLEVVDRAANVWHVTGMLSSTGAAFATPFSTT